MNKIILFIVSVLLFTVSNMAFSQTDDEIISKYLDATGGKERINKIISLFTESKSELAGTELVIRTYILNGKAFKNEMVLAGASVTNCLTEKGGWSINTSTGSTKAVTMNTEQYNSGKSQMFIGTPFIRYKEMGYKAELIGNEFVGEVNAVKILLITPDNDTSFHCFDPATGYLIKSVNFDESTGQKTESTRFFSDYRESNGYILPYVTILNQGGSFELTSRITKVEVDEPMDVGTFEMPEEGSVGQMALKNEATSIYKSTYDNTDPVCNCEDLLKIEIPDTKIESVVLDPGNSSCRVKAIVNHPPFEDKVTVTIILPANNWNGRFLGLGGAGFAGGVPFPLNGPVSTEGFAMGFTDGGHEGSSGAFTFNEKENRLNWQNIRDFAHVAIHDMTVVGKSLVQAFYGKPAKYSYFVGGSTGGRQAMSEVQRYPEDYDGILANYPAVYYSQILMGFLWPQAVMNDTKNYVSGQKIKAVTEAVITACDGDDGVTDGVIDDPINCTWDPKEFVGTKVGNEVFTDADADVVRRIWEGPRGYNDKFLWYGLTRGSNLLAYAATKGVPLTGMPDMMAVEWVRYFLLNNPSWDITSLTITEFESLFNQAVEQYYYLFETSDPDLSRFRDLDGKLIITHGLADNMIPPQGTIRYYELLQGKMGGAKATSKFARLFLFSGLDHSLMGPGVRPVDTFGALLKWVEEGKAPEYLHAEFKDKKGEVIRRKSIYPYVKSNK